MCRFFAGLIAVVSVAAVLGPAGCNRDEGKIRVAFVSNNPADFWRIAHAGVRRAEKEFGVVCEFHMPPDGSPADQQRIVEALIAKGVQGMAVSVNDPENQIELLNRAAEVMPVICTDSDAPKSNRLCYIGTNNFKAGRAVGKLVREVVPDGGKVMLFVGRLDTQNAIERSGGVKAELEGTNIEVIDTLTDLTDRARAKANVQDTIARYPDIACLVGLWAYNPPAILSAVKDAGKEGQIAIVGFDEEDDTLQGIEDGHIHATVVQNPYQFGYRSVKMLAAMAGGKEPEIPDNGLIEVPVRVIRKDNVRKFWDELKELTGQK